MRKKEIVKPKIRFKIDRKKRTVTEYRDKGGNNRRGNIFKTRLLPRIGGRKKSKSHNITRVPKSSPINKVKNPLKIFVKTFLEEIVDWVE